MRNNIIFSLILIGLFTVFASCSRTGSNGKKALSDSLISATQNIAIGNANFGISEKAFNRQFPDSLANLGGNKHIVSAYFDNNGGLEKVYLVDEATFNNQKFDANLMKRLELIKAYFMNTYGQPDEDRGYPIQKKMQDGKLFESYVWEVGKKRISAGIGLEKTAHGDIYYVLSHVDRQKITN